MDDNNQNLAKQYQDILDRYSRELASAPAEPPQPENKIENQPPQPEPEPVPSSEETMTSLPLSTPEPEPAQIPLPPDPIITPPPEPSFVPPLPPVEPVAYNPPSQMPPLDIDSPPKKSGGFFKILFFISLLIFLGVLGSIIYTIYQGNNPSPNGSTALPTTTSQQPSPTPIATNVCQVNDKQYQVGESFLSADGCNTCTCSGDLTIACTSKACEATPSVKLVPTTKLQMTPTPIVLIPKKQTLPADLVSVVKFNVIKDSTVPVTNDQIVIGESILSGNFAEVSYNITNSGGAIYWLTKVGGSWQVVTSGQQPPSCITLAKYNFPASFSCN